MSYGCAEEALSCFHYSSIVRWQNDPRVLHFCLDIIYSTTYVQSTKLAHWKYVGEDSCMNFRWE